MKYTRHSINAQRDKLEYAIDNCIVGFKAIRNRQIMKMHYIDGWTYEEIAEELNLSDRHVKTICYEHEPAIINYLRAE